MGVATRWAAPLRLLLPKCQQEFSAEDCARAWARGHRDSSILSARRGWSGALILSTFRLFVAGAARVTRHVPRGELSGDSVRFYGSEWPVTGGMLPKAAPGLGSSKSPWLAGSGASDYHPPARSAFARRPLGGRGRGLAYSEVRGDRGGRLGYRSVSLTNWKPHDQRRPRAWPCYRLDRSPMALDHRFRDEEAQP